MLADLKVMLEKRDFEEGNTSTPGDFVVERAFVEKIKRRQRCRHKGEPTGRGFMRLRKAAAGF